MKIILLLSTLFLLPVCEANAAYSSVAQQRFKEGCLVDIAHRMKNLAVAQQNVICSCLTRNLGSNGTARFTDNDIILLGEGLRRGGLPAAPLSAGLPPPSSPKAYLAIGNWAGFYLLELNRDPVKSCVQHGG